MERQQILPESADSTDRVKGKQSQVVYQAQHWVETMWCGRPDIYTQLVFHIKSTRFAVNTCGPAVLMILEVKEEKEASAPGRERRLLEAAAVKQVEHQQQQHRAAALKHVHGLWFSTHSHQHHPTGAHPSAAACTSQQS